MSRNAAILLIATLITSACGTAPSIWGIAGTPTPQSGVMPSPLDDPVAGQPETDISPLQTLIPSNEQPVTPAPAATSPAVVPTFTPSYGTAPFLYYAQSGDMLKAIAARFGVEESEITSTADLSGNFLIPPGTLLIIPNNLNEEPTTPNVQILPDAEFVFSPSAIDFDTAQFVRGQGGYLSRFKDYLGSTGLIDGHAAIDRLAYENSVNPRLLLTVLEHESGWVKGEPVDILHTDFPMGFNDYRFKGMYIQMVWAINTMSIGYYGWRAGTLTHLEFPDGTTLRIDPHLNAGTVAMQYLFSRIYNQSQWAGIIGRDGSFPRLYNELFGDPWALAEDVTPLIPPGLIQPPLVLPFEPNVQWNYTGGPHNGWGQINPSIYGRTHTVYAAVDFGPPTKDGGCSPSDSWVVASAPGLVVRSENGAVVVDLDGDGYEQTGWNILYMHIARKDRVPAGTWLETNDRIGHASCEGGVSTGTHVHIARKFNGEWITVDGPIPFIMSGWLVVAGNEPYKGLLVRDDKVVTADLLGQSWSSIIREEDD
jgi:LysM repeat protein